VAQKVTTLSGRVTESEECAQIFVDGNVIIGGEVLALGNTGNWLIRIKDDEGRNIWRFSKVRGRVSVVATGNIWIVSPIEYDGQQVVEFDQDDRLVKKVPRSDNENVLSLFSQNGVVKVVDPSLSQMVPQVAGSPQVFTDDVGLEVSYRPIGFRGNSGPGLYNRDLPQSMVVQASITAGGGGWGVENVGSATAKPEKGYLIVAGAITEVVQGAVSHGQRGYNRRYYFDERFSRGILSCDMGLQSKYIVAPGGWSDKDYSQYIALSN
ncbi:MAG: hypothetical protein KAJ19_03600, partial [Gammaproteobacteria bacterium]|nr:hypothetical protein [Gammaproteobacteria bacterium]